MPGAEGASAAAPSGGRGLRVLAAVELGGQWGHLLRIKPVLEGLRERGHIGVLATTDVPAARRLFDSEPIEVVACPSLRLMKPVPRGTRYKHYAQILDLCAFGDDAMLAANVRHWMALIDRVRPDAMLTDFSPLALFVAHLKRLPVVQIPTGWEAPPHGQPLPLISIEPAPEQDRAPWDEFEARMLARLNRQCAAHGVAPLRHLSDVYAIGTQLLACWPQTDHFAPRTAARYIGPIYSEREGVTVEWPEAQADRPRVFVYLAPGRHNVSVLETLRDAGADVMAVMPGLPPAVAERLRGPRLQIVDGPVHLGAALTGLRLTISNGGHGLTGASLRRGVPMLIVPRTAEQFILGSWLAEQGVAQVLGAVGAGDAAEIVTRALHDEDSLAKAAAVAVGYADHSLARTLREVVEAIERAGRPALAQT